MIPATTVDGANSLASSRELFGSASRVGGFSLITSGEGTEAAYKEYQLALRNFNYQLMILKQVLGLTSEVSSYTARHTWATMAYYCEVHPGVISEAMGHSSITVTETYLKPFKNKKIDEANVAVISSLKKVYSVGKLLN